ncbi:immunoglobulin domain-containing protein [Opitutus terrae]|uniref:Immunoglobulin I-set domain protein n=1 Tax=Opitutus terrae (strain DSM 11246 / JCM 15787 / PB90-1) TaxID=452637 RepID=B1ZVI8_OPITP|nr:immunoglobulin domain-containing protein [Opitutus terrae]ACB74085.1 Immunoglobulin I-set domain protein [Opitutus terrae PB90-1]
MLPIHSRLVRTGLLLGALAFSSFASLHAQTLFGSDDFNDNTLTIGAGLRWRFETDVSGSGGAFAERNQRLEFTAAQSTGATTRALGWISPSTSGESFGVDWQATVKVSNSAAPAAGFASAGLEAYTLADTGGGNISSSAYYGAYLSTSASSGKQLVAEWGRWDATLNGGSGGWVRNTQGIPIAATANVLLRLTWIAATRTMTASFSTDGGTRFEAVRSFALAGAEAGIGAPYANGFGLQLVGVAPTSGAIAAGQITFDDMSVSPLGTGRFAGSDDFSGGADKWEFFFRLPYLTEGTNGLGTFNGSAFEFTKGAGKGSYLLEWDGDGVPKNNVARTLASYTTSWVMDVTATNRHVPESGTFSAVSIEVSAGVDSYYEISLFRTNSQLVVRAEAMSPSDPGVNLTAPENAGVRLRIAWDATTRLLTASCSFDDGVTYSTLRTIATSDWPTLSTGGFYFQALGFSTSAAPIGTGQLLLDDFSVRAAPTVTAQPASQALAAGAPVVLNVAADATATFQWQQNGGAVAGATTDTLTLDSVQPAQTGLYQALVTSPGGVTVSGAAIVGVTTTSKVIGTGEEIGANIRHSNGNVFDQVAVTGAAESITADFAANQITRTSFIDADNDIVQIEFSGPGTLSLVLDAPSGPALPVNYNQNFSYMKGHAGIVITGATEQTNLSVFTVGRATAVNQTLFKDGVNYDGFADIAFIAIQSSNGRFGGVRTANATYFASKGLTGLYAPGVTFDGPVYLGDITAFDEATPVLVIGSANGNTWITGGDLEQANGRPVQVSGLTQLQFQPGSDSHGNTLSARTNQARLEQDGTDVTTQIAVNP